MRGGAARTGLLVAALLVLLGVVQPATAPPHAPAATRPVSAGHVWQDTPHTSPDQPLRLVAARPAPPTAADTWWLVCEPATDDGPPRHLARADEAGPAHRGCAAPPPRSSRAPPVNVS